MNFDFSDDMTMLRDQARKFLAEQCPPAAVRAVLEGRAPFDRALWQQVAQMGWLGAAVPEAFGGAGLGHEGLCVIAEELGRVLAPIPFSSTAFLATEALLAHGSAAQKAQWLPKLAAGERIACFALAEGADNPRAAAVAATVTTTAQGSRLQADKWPVADGGIADLAVVVARDAATGAIGLYLAELVDPADGAAAPAPAAPAGSATATSATAPGITRTPLQTLDPSRDAARLQFNGTAVQPLAEDGAAPVGWDAVQALLDRAAVLTAFEQLGGAQACLDMATAYAKERIAFGRPIGSFQAIKHKLADVYIAVELARSNAYYGAWALQADAPELPLAAAAARVAATEAFHQASKENIQTHGGMGFTWEMDCHLYYRRAKALAVGLGSARHWKHRLVALWDAADAAATGDAPFTAPVTPPVTAAGATTATANATANAAATAHTTAA